MQKNRIPDLKLLKRNSHSGSLCRLCNGYFLLRVGKLLEKMIAVVFFSMLILRIGESLSPLMVVLLFRELFAAKQMVSISFLFSFFKKSIVLLSIISV